MSIVLFRGSKSEVDLGGNRQEGRVRESKGQVEFLGGHGYKDSDVMMRGRDENTTRYTN